MVTASASSLPCQKHISRSYFYQHCACGDMYPPRWQSGFPAPLTSFGATRVTLNDLISNSNPAFFIVSQNCFQPPPVIQVQGHVHISRYLLQQHPTSWYQNLFWFPVAVVTKYPKPGGLKQQEFTSSQMWSPEPKIKALAKLSSLWRL